MVQTWSTVRAAAIMADSSLGEAVDSASIWTVQRSS